MNPFLEKLTTFDELDSLLLSRIAMFINHRTVIRNQYLQKPGQFIDNIYFIESGIVTRYYKSEDRRVYTDFLGKGDLIFDVATFLTKERCKDYLQVYKPGSLFYLSRNGYDTICCEFPYFHTYLNRILIVAYKALECKLNILRARASDRYMIFQKEYPSLFQYIPKEYIKSYCSTSSPSLRKGSKLK